MNEKEVIERFKEGLMKAISGCKEMAALTKYAKWTDIANQLSKFHYYGSSMASAKPITEGEAQRLVSENVEKKRKSAEIVNGIRVN